jgi:basic amino acid/polyamine antiporter, APA family
VLLLLLLAPAAARDAYTYLPAVLCTSSSAMMASPKAPAAAGAPPASPTATLPPSPDLLPLGHGGVLKRDLGVWDLTSLGIGGIIGAGVYVLTGKAAALYAGPGVALSFVVSGIACLFSALCYAELSSMIPAAGSAYSFATATMGQVIGWLIGWDLLLEYLFGAATVAVGWSGYFCSLLKDAGAPCAEAIADAPVGYDTNAETWRSTSGVMNLPAILITVAMTAVQVRGIRESARLNTALVIVKVAVLLVFVFVGFAYVKPSNWDPFIPPSPEGSPWRYGFGGVLRGSAYLFFAFIGFDALSAVSQEARDPQRTVPLATMISLAVCTALYVIVGLVLTGIVSYKQLDVADPIAVALDAAGGDELLWLRVPVKIGAILGLTSVIMVQILGQARILYAMSLDGLLPPIFARVHPTYRTPIAATMMTGGAAAFIAGVLPIDVLGEMVSIGTLFAFAVVCSGVITLRIRHPNLRRPFKAPFFPYVPALGVITAVGQMAALPAQSWLRLFLWMCLGMVVYFLYGRHHATPIAARQAKLLGLAYGPDGGGGAGGAAGGSDGGAGAAGVEDSPATDWRGATTGAQGFKAGHAGETRRMSAHVGDVSMADVYGELDASRGGAQVVLSPLALAEAGGGAAAGRQARVAALAQLPAAHQQKVGPDDAW